MANYYTGYSGNYTYTITFNSSTTSGNWYPKNTWRPLYGKTNQDFKNVEKKHLLSKERGW